MDYNYPYRIGVTGHKSLTEVEKQYISKELVRVITTVQRTIDTRRKAAGINSDFFITGITSLAEGADRVFAAEIINQGGILEVVLPFRKEIYMQDFWGEDSKTNFLNMLSFDSCPLVVDSSANPHKELAYYNTAKTIVDQCDLLIGVWDETPVKSKAGTEGIIEYAKQNGVPTIVLYTKPNRDSDKENKESIEGISLEQYKKFDKDWKPLIKKYEADKKPVLNSAALKAGLSEEDNARFGLLFNAYHIWDAAAIKSDKQSRMPLRIVYILAAIASLSGLLAYTVDHFDLLKLGLTKPLLQQQLKLTPSAFEKFRDLFHQSWELFYGLEALSLLVILIVTIAAFGGGKQKKRWVQARLWAEKMRLQIYKLTMLATGGEVIDENHGEALLRSRSLDSRLFMLLSKEIWNGFKTPFTLDERIDLLNKEFIQGSITERTKQLKKQKLLRTRLSGLNALIFAVALLSSFTLLVNHFVTLRLAFPIGILQALSLLAPLTALIIEGWRAVLYSEKLVHNNGSLEKRLQDLTHVFPELCTTEDDLNFVFHKAESVILDEHSEWNLLVRHPEWKL